MRREIQTVAAMTEELSSERKKKLYKEQSDSYKKAELSSLIANEKALLQAAHANRKIDLKDVGLVQELTYRYMTACENAGAVPTISGLASAFGISRQWLREWLITHPSEPSAAFIEAAKTSFSNVLLQAGLRRDVDNILTIFLLKNSGQGYSDQQEVTIIPQVTEPSSAEIREKYRDLPDE